MEFSRRQFLSAASGAGLALVARGVADVSRETGAPQTGFDRVILDLGGGCGLRESLAGYQAALAGAGFGVVRVPPTETMPARTIIVPGCVRLHPAEARALAASLSQGAMVLIESAAGFADGADGPDFEHHREQLCSHFGLAVEAPVDLWRPERVGGTARVPYVDYVWPVAVKVRDFSRVVPVESGAAKPAWQRGAIIGWTNGRPVAARRRVGRGTLVFLGSPLGPLLGWGDREARQWLAALAFGQGDASEARKIVGRIELENAQPSLDGVAHLT